MKLNGYIFVILGLFVFNCNFLKSSFKMLLNFTLILCLPLNFKLESICVTG